MKRSDYREIIDDAFPERIEIHLYHDSELQKQVYRKQYWHGRGLRYGDNPDQPAAYYSLVEAGISEEGVEYVSSEQGLLGSMEILHGGKQISKTNLCDINTSLEIMRYFTEPLAVIVKHNNPSSVASSTNIEEAFSRAYAADSIAAFGGLLCVNRNLTSELAANIAQHYFEVIVAPSYDTDALAELSQKKNLRVIALPRLEGLAASYEQLHYLDISALLDGSIVLQRSFRAQTEAILHAAPARALYREKEYSIQCSPNDDERRDMIFGWCLQSAISSNSIVYVQDQCTVGISTGEQDRVGAASIARDKAYRNRRAFLARKLYAKSYAQLSRDEVAELEASIQEDSAGLRGSVMISDGFFPFRDAVDIAIDEGISAILQPGGSIRDFESIQACNEANVSMIFSGQRGFRH